MSLLSYLSTLSLPPPLLFSSFSLYSDGPIAWIILHLKNQSVNVFHSLLAQELDGIMDILEQGIGKQERKGKNQTEKMESGKGVEKEKEKEKKSNEEKENEMAEWKRKFPMKIQVVVVCSGKVESFVAGADITEMAGMVDAKKLEALAKEGQRVMQRIAALRVPTIAAINGACLGGGLELALACSYRVAGSNRKVELGLPEVKLGLIPGSTGTVKLAKLVGLQNALQIILPGGSVKPNKALRIGLVDRVFADTDAFPGEHLFYRQVREFAISKIGTSVERNFGNPKESYQDYFLNRTSLGNYLVASTAANNLDKLTKGKYPAPYQALDSVIHSLSTDLKSAYAYEAAAFGRCGASPESKALISLFFMIEEAKKVKGKVSGQPIPLKKVGVIGAGVMGAQIAQICASKKFDVYLRDIKEDLVQNGLKFIASIYQAKVAKKKMTQDVANSFIQRVKGGTHIKPFSECQILIEAAVEQMSLKKKILEECESTTPSNTIFATNTSSLSITELALSAKRPQNVVGLHFFNPVSKMPLVEVIRGKETSAEAVATAYQLALDLGKFPVICGDCPGFVVNRILGIYMNEAGIIVMEGQDFRHVDGALLKFGMPMGPMRLMDEVGLDVAGHVGPILEDGLGARYKQIPQFAKILKENPKHLGKKTSSGFYIYDAKGKQSGVNEFIARQIDSAQKKRQATLSATEIADRCILIMLNEAAYILSEGIVAHPEELDLAMVMGTGFAPFTGGLLNYADNRGIKKCVDRLVEFEKKYGFRFKPHPLLIKMATNNERFFPNRPQGMTKIALNPRSRL